VRAGLTPRVALLAAMLALGATAAGCAYFNTFHSAKKHFADPERPMLQRFHRADRLGHGGGDLLVRHLLEILHDDHCALIRRKHRQSAPHMRGIVRGLGQLLRRLHVGSWPETILFRRLPVDLVDGRP